MDVNSQFWPEADSGGIRILGDRKIGCDGGLNQMNFEGGLSIPPERLNPMRGNWMPITPDKQIQRSNQGNQFPAEEWQQLTGMYGAIIQEPTTNFIGGAQNFNPMGAVQNAGCYGDLAERSSREHSNIAGSYAQAINMDRPSWDGRFSLANLMAMRNAAMRSQTNRSYRGIPMGNAQLIPDLHPQVDTSRRRPYAGTTPLTNVNHWSTSNQMGACNNISQIPQHGFPVPYRSNNYNLNLPPRAETDATTISNSVGISTLPQNESDKFGGIQFSAMLNLLSDESSIKKNDQENFVPLVGNEEVRHPCNELQNIVDSSSTVISTPFKENTDSEKASDQYIDLNKTPQLKAPKRRKIRPKVVIEGKPKRLPKSAGQSSKENQTAKRKYVRKTGLKESGSQQAVTINSPTHANPENTDSKENTTGKRKYVRRKGVTESATQQADIRHGNTDPNAGRATKSCRRGLNFDLKKSSDDDQGKISGQEEVRESMRPSNLNLDSRETELGAGTSSLCETRSDGQISQQGRTTGTSNFTPSMADMLNNYISLLGRQAEGAPQASMIGRHIENSNISSIDGNADQWLRKSQLGYTPRQQNIYAEGIGQIVYQTKKSEENTETTRQPMSQNRPYQVLNTFSNFIGARGSKREFQQMLEQGECYRNSSNFGTGLSETHKRKRFENGLLTRVYGMPLVRAVDDASREDSTKSINGVGINCFKSQINQEILTSYFDNCKSPRKLSSGVNNFNGSMDPHCKAAGPNLPQQQAPELHSYTDRMGETRRVMMVQNLASLTTCESHNLHPPATPRKASAKGKGQVKRTFHTTEQADLQAQDTLNKQLSIQSKGLTGWKENPIQIDEIINRLKGLNLKESDHTLLRQEQKALVLYKGNGAIVLQDIKKSKPRPKVDLDPETNRIWKLLIGNEGSEGIEGTDKEKWWEGEREVFRGRANSFIARMHLVQGDRRFSPWKGSVVDSVIGVFLTQNVSDHLSSSAFMCLAARFPLNSTSNETYVSNGKNILVEEPEDCIVNQENVSCLPVYNPSSITPQELRDQRRDSEASGTERTSFTEAQSQSIEEEIISSQGSYDSSIVQDNEGIRSSSGSNSEAEDPINGSIYKMSHGSSFTNFQEMEKTTMFQECCSRVNGSSILDERSNYQNKQLERMECSMPRSRLQMDNLKSYAFTYPITSQDQIRVPAAPSKNCVSHMNPEFRAQEYNGIFCEESASPLSSTSSEFIKAKDANCTSNLMVENVSENNIQHSRLLRSQEILTMGPFELSSRHSVQHDSISQTKPHTEHAKTFQHNYPSGRNNSFQTENISVAEPLKHAEGLANWKNDSMNNIPNVSKQMENASDIEEHISVMTKQSNAENKSVKPKPKEQVHFSSKADNEMNTKAKKVKAENEGKKTFDWDSLRKQVQANGRKERSKDAMDTMDYEAMRCAKVKEISDAIKERGMNNMIAERIQDFLNRLVREHGGIDLEWLRDVPPDKAKEYLLSIRGLGLKSVECVRLLTLQQLAFPVDTNVGRIAVRLGWVPLQPLPESLQLHLLEMYPILESVQKYIWPRLCKLDQRTLYELHYQMITFGKVFCTKNKPNCNACPMKGECRHFASAFASARLALPSPEEKSIVTSTFPTAQAENPTAVINPMLLLKEAGPGIGKCDPIIEEPATPEQERAEILETDIEDMFDEDPNEIPTIKLNIETFTENLQKYMKDNMELQEGDMSKALVALNPEAAAIPTPKLKNVSRLRTEHQVYELPDSHPLLEGMERREPDEPSPYLLAIWTPGETADSVQTPEIRCSFQDTGKLCNDDTCFSSNCMRESNSQTVRGTILVPCRTAMRGSFPLNGTYFQVNEMFADHDSSVNPIDVPRAWIWNLPRRTVYFGTSVSTIFKGLSTEGIQYCFWRGFVCVRGFDHNTRAPRPLSRRLHTPASKLVKQ